MLVGQHRRGRPARSTRPAGGRPGRPARSPRRTAAPAWSWSSCTGRARIPASSWPSRSCWRITSVFSSTSSSSRCGKRACRCGHDVRQQVRRERREQAHAHACPTPGPGPGGRCRGCSSASSRITRARSTTRSPASVSMTWRGLRSISSTPSSLLELLDLGRQRRLADEAGLGGPAEVAVLGHGDQVLEVAEVHRPSVRPTACAGSTQRLRLGVRRRLGGRGRADQVVEGAERGRRAGAHGDDDLLVRHRGAVAGGEHAGHRGLAAVVDHDLAARRQLDRALEPLGVGQQADLDEHAVEVDACACSPLRAVLVDAGR